MIPTSRRLEYAAGYLGLGLLKEAAAELAAVAEQDRSSPGFMALAMHVHTAADEWDRVAEYARRLLALDENNVGAWVALGCAVRRTDSVLAAKQLLLQAERLHGATHPVISYNLACYTCLLGELEVAKGYFSTACRMDAHFKRAALEDPDLKALAAFVRAVNAA